VETPRTVAQWREDERRQAIEDEEQAEERARSAEDAAPDTIVIDARANSFDDVVAGTGEGRLKASGRSTKGPLPGSRARDMRRGAAASRGMAEAKNQDLGGSR
jgi:hypothetical protein